MRERRALLTSVRRAIFRVAFLADFVLAIRVPLRCCAPVVAMWGGRSAREKTAAANRRSPPDGQAYRQGGGGRQRPRPPVAAAGPSRSGHALGPRLVVAGRDRGGIGGREGGERRHHPGEGGVAMDM